MILLAKKAKKTKTTGPQWHLLDQVYLTNLLSPPFLCFMSLNAICNLYTVARAQGPSSGKASSILSEVYTSPALFHKSSSLHSQVSSPTSASSWGTWLVTVKIGGRGKNKLASVKVTLVLVSNWQTSVERRAKNINLNLKRFTVLFCNPLSSPGYRRRRNHWTIKWFMLNAHLIIYE